MTPPPPHPADPYRAANWRQLRAAQLAQAEFPAARRDDKWVRRQKAFLSGLASPAAERRERAAVADPAVFAAWRLADAPAGSPLSQLRAVAEARLLAGQEPAEVAALAGLDADAGEAFAAVHFDVQSRLSARDWVITHLVVPALEEQLARRDGTRRGAVALPALDGTLRLFAYLGGPLLVDLLVSGAAELSKARTGAEAEAWMDGQWRRTLKRRSLQAAQLVELNRHNFMELATLHGRLVELGRLSAQAGGGKGGGVVDAVQAFLAAHPISPARADSKDARPGYLRAAADRAADLTGPEYAAAVCGVEPDPAALDEPAFPTPAGPEAR